MSVNHKLLTTQIVPHKYFRRYPLDLFTGGGKMLYMQRVRTNFNNLIDSKSSIVKSSKKSLCIAVLLFEFVNL